MNLNLILETDERMKTSAKKQPAKETSNKTAEVHTPVPPQVQYPLEKPDSKKESAIQTR